MPSHLPRPNPATVEPPLRFVADCIPDAGCQQFLFELEKTSFEEKPYSSCLHHSSGKELPWAKSRVIKRDGGLVLELLVDSTLGSCARGYSLHEPRGVASDYVCGEQDYRRGSPAAGRYVAADLSGLRPEGWSRDLPITTELVCPVHKTNDPDGSSATTPAYRVEIEIRWLANDIPIPVDIAVDFGNTRTCVVAKESVAGKSINDSLRPILFLKDGQAYDRDSGERVADSYLVLRESPLSGMAGEVTICDWKSVTEGWLLKKNKEVVFQIEKKEPHLFVQVSPAILGRDAKERTCEFDVTQGSTSISSPKRYIGQTDPLSVGHEGQWTMLTKDSKAVEGKSKSKPLGGKVVRFLSESDRPWTRENPLRNEEFKDQPAYPRAQAMTWAALSIIEGAASQINSVNWRGGVARRRYLRNIAVTHPAGWTEAEVEQYRRRWREALDIFALTRFDTPFAKPADQGPPNLLLGDQFAPDEAVASQLPFVYSEMLRLDNIGDNWMELYGRPRKEGGYTVRVMSIDIGGGTTDIAIIEYRDEMSGSGIQLTTRHLFGDSVAVAGDMVIEKILKEVIFPRLPDSPEQFEEFAKFFGETTSGEASNRGRYATLIWEPLVRDLLKRVAHTSDEVITISNPLKEPGFETEIHGDQLRGFIDKLTGELGTRGVESSADDFDIKVSELNRCWTEIFAPLARSWAAYAAALEVDLLLVSGKPSEQPSIRELIHQMIPLTSPRIIFAKNFEAGSWWPMGDKQVADAKHVTAVGLALYSAIQRGEEPDWAITSDPGEPSAWWNRNYWGKITEKMEKLRANDIFLHPSDDEASSRMQVGSRIARQLLKEGGHADFIYELRWRDIEKRKLGEAIPRPTVTVTLRRKSSASGEQLELISAMAEDGREMLQDVELHLNTMVAKTHWRDSGRFSRAEPVGR